MREIEWKISDKNAQKISKLKFKKIMDKKVNTCARKYLENMKKSKTDHLKIHVNYSAELWKTTTSHPIKKGLVTCSVRSGDRKHLNIDFNSVSYSMIFGSIVNQEKLVNIYQIMVQTIFWNQNKVNFPLHQVSYVSPLWASEPIVGE